MGKLLLEASWRKSTCESGRVRLELDLMFVILFVELTFIVLVLKASSMESP